DKAPASRDAIRDGKAAIDKLRSDGAPAAEIERRARAALDAALSAGENTPFDHTYYLRDELIKKDIGYEKITTDAMVMQAAEGVEMSEQSVSIKKLKLRLGEALMLKAKAEAAKLGAHTDMRMLAMVETELLTANGMSADNTTKFDTAKRDLKTLLE